MPPKKKIENYELGKTLRTGSFSKVKLGTDVETGDSWAIGVVRKDEIDPGDSYLQQRIAMGTVVNPAAFWWMTNH